MTDEILEFENVTKTFVRSGVVNRQRITAVDKVSFSVLRGQTVGLVGESGSGKTTLARIALGLIGATSGIVRFEGASIDRLSGSGWRNVRQRMQPVFQDPASSLNPRKQVHQIVQAPLDVHRLGSSSSRRSVVVDELNRVGLGSKYLARFPHQLSGGERQRVAIARALVMRPHLIIADEPTSALDVSVQAELLRLLASIQRDLGIAYLFISHNLAVVRHVADWVGVMYLGRIIEFGSREQVFTSPQHPYTKALLSSVPIPDPARNGEHRTIVGELPDPSHIPSGCRFRDRCPDQFDRCVVEDPQDYETLPGKRVACHLYASGRQQLRIESA